MLAQFHAHVAGSELTIVAEIDEVALIWLGVAVGFGEPGQCTQWMPRTVVEIRATLRAVQEALASDDGSAEFLMIAGIPFDCREAAALLSILITVLGAYGQRRLSVVRSHG